MQGVERERCLSQKATADDDDDVDDVDDVFFQLACDSVEELSILRWIRCTHVVSDQKQLSCPSTCLVEIQVLHVSPDELCVFASIGRTKVSLRRKPAVICKSRLS